ncbi:collagen alpha-4(VI) chain [Elysia marginata]|uniref:Collagen alpha-4(VI) chain n=1 Tax=Elysia marginata TaxID=1093978 RepID=A0AAV4JTR7_9GAST|nr:collagen alpha-4(VI) chain [Elysia marginata]
MAVRNFLTIWPLVFTALTCVAVICDGFEFTFTALPPKSGQNCGVLQCSEKLSNNKHEANSGNFEISSLTIYKLNTSHGGRGENHWVKMAAVTPQSPRYNRTSDCLSVIGNLTDTQGSLTLEMFKPEDCASAEFYCVAEAVNTDRSQSTLMKSYIKTAGQSFSNQDYRTNSPEAFLPSNVDSGLSVGCAKNEDRFTLLMWEKLKYIEMRMEEYLRNQNTLRNQLQATDFNRLDDKLTSQVNGLSNQLQASEIRIGDRIDRLENRLEDKLTGQVIGSTSQSQGNKTDTCGEMSSKLSGLDGSVGAIVKNFKSFDKQMVKAETAASLASSKLSELDGKLETLSTGLSVVTNLTENLVSDFGGLSNGLSFVTNFTENLVSDFGGLSTGLSVVTNLTENLVSDFGGFRESFASNEHAPVGEFFDPLNTGWKEWRLAFRGTAYNNIPVYPAFLYGTGIPPEVEAGCKQFDHSLACINHYRNKDALENWSNVDEVLFAIYVKGQMVHHIMFNARGTDYIHWFEERRVILSSWTDLKRLSHNKFSISGHALVNGHHRRFLINHRYLSCPLDLGWFGAFDNLLGCPYETKNVAIPVFLYAPGKVVSRFQIPNVGRADAFGIFLKYHKK